MLPHLILWPIVGQIMLTVALYFMLARRKSAAVAAGEVDVERRGLFDDAWPKSVVQVNNCIKNQFEVPILFYVLILSLSSLNAVNIVTHIIAWVFLITRIMHAVVHTGSNYVPLRRKVFIINLVLILALLVQTCFALLQM